MSRLTESERLGAEITELCAYIFAATYHLLELIRVFDGERHWETLGFSSGAHWLNFYCGLGMNAAREHLRVAHALAGLPRISAAFAEGRISYSKARAVTRIATPEQEDYLLVLCEHGTGHQLERFVAQYRRALKYEESDFALSQVQCREATWHYADDGSVVIRATLPPDQGEVVLQALEKAIDLAPSRDEPDGEREPIAARRADALAVVAETYLGNGGASGSAADRYQVVLHVRSESAGVDRANNAHYIENGPRVSAETSARLACDCSTVTVTEDEQGEPLSIGRRSRTIPPAIRRALWARDGGCRFPGCTHHRFVDGHHIVHWQHGGETSLDNLVLLCRHHHRLVHEGGFDCARSDDGEIYFADRNRARLPDYAAPREVTLAESMAYLYRKFRDKNVSAETCVAKQTAGERMDYGYAVSVMFPTKKAG